MLMFLTSLSEDVLTRDRNAALDKTKTGKFSRGSTDKLVDQANRHEVSKTGKSFLDLPGELRNQIYEHAFQSCPAFSYALALGSSCRQAQLEYLLLFFKRGRVRINIYFLQQFLERFFPNDATDDEKENAICTIDIIIGLHSSFREYPIIDMQFLIEFLKKYSNIGVCFYKIGPKYPWACMLDADDLWELFEIVWQSPVFCERLANFESVTLTQGILKFVHKREDVQHFWHNKWERYNCTKATLFDMGLRYSFSKIRFTFEMAGTRGFDPNTG
jgi:hypothetical protein